MAAAAAPAPAPLDDARVLIETRADDVGVDAGSAWTRRTRRWLVDEGLTPASTTLRYAALQDAARRDDADAVRNLLNEWRDALPTPTTPDWSPSSYIHGARGDDDTAHRRPRDRTSSSSSPPPQLGAPADREASSRLAVAIDALKERAGAAIDAAARNAAVLPLALDAQRALFDASRRPLSLTVCGPFVVHGGRRRPHADTVAHTHDRRAPPASTAADEQQRQVHHSADYHRHSDARKRSRGFEASLYEAQAALNGVTRRGVPLVAAERRLPPQPPWSTRPADDDDVWRRPSAWPSSLRDHRAARWRRMLTQSTLMPWLVDAVDQTVRRATSVDARSRTASSAMHVRDVVLPTIDAGHRLVDAIRSVVAPPTREELDELLLDAMRDVVEQSADQTAASYDRALASHDAYGALPLDHTDQRRCHVRQLLSAYADGEMLAAFDGHARTLIAERAPTLADDLAVRRALTVGVRETWLSDAVVASNERAIAAGARQRPAVISDDAARTALREALAAMYAETWRRRADDVVAAAANPTDPNDPTLPPLDDHGVRASLLSVASKDVAEALTNAGRRGRAIAERLLADDAAGARGFDADHVVRFSPARRIVPLSTAMRRLSDVWRESDVGVDAQLVQRPDMAGPIALRNLRDRASRAFWPPANAVDDDACPLHDALADVDAGVCVDAVVDRALSLRVHVPQATLGQMVTASSSMTAVWAIDGAPSAEPTRASPMRDGAVIDLVAPVSRVRSGLYACRVQLRLGDVVVAEGQSATTRVEVERRCVRCGVRYDEATNARDSCRWAIDVGAILRTDGRDDARDTDYEQRRCLQTYDELGDGGFARPSRGRDYVQTATVAEMAAVDIDAPGRTITGKSDALIHQADAVRKSAPVLAAVPIGRYATLMAKVRERDALLTAQQQGVEEQLTPEPRSTRSMEHARPRQHAVHSEATLAPESGDARWLAGRTTPLETTLGVLAGGLSNSLVTYVGAHDDVSIMPDALVFVTPANPTDGSDANSNGGAARVDDGWRMADLEDMSGPEAAKVRVDVRRTSLRAETYGEDAREVARLAAAVSTLPDGAMQLMREAALYNERLYAAAGTRQRPLS